MVVDLFYSCDLDLDQMTFTYELYPYSVPGDTLDVQIRTSHVKAFESYRLTDRQTESTEIINHAASRLLLTNKIDIKSEIRPTGYLQNVNATALMDYNEYQCRTSPPNVFGDISIPLLQI